MKSREELEEIFSKYYEKNFIFSCGSGITASILALGAKVAGINSKAIYDGSWTEWESLEELPVEVGELINLLFKVAVGVKQCFLLPNQLYLLFAIRS
jgi:hypothetical protein